MGNLWVLIVLVIVVVFLWTGRARKYSDEEILVSFPRYKFIDENGDVMKDYVEKREMNIAQKFIDPESTVLELGARYGTVSVITNKKLRDPTKHVVVEPDSAVWEALESNRDFHDCQFGVVKGVLSKKPSFLKRTRNKYANFISSRSDGEKVRNFDFDQLQRDYGLLFDTLIIDCEGCMEQLMKDFPNILDNINFITFEQDYDCASKPAGSPKCNYDWIKAELRRRDFKQHSDAHHQVWHKYPYDIRRNDKVF